MAVVWGWTVRLAAIALLGLAAASILTVAWNVIFDDPLLGITMKGVKESCEETGFACSVATSIFFTVGPLAVGSFVFVFWRLQRVQRPLVREARERPAELVETVGEIVGRVVGRDDVCNVLQDDLRDNKNRRPHVVVGGVGIGEDSRTRAPDRAARAPWSRPRADPPSRRRPRRRLPPDGATGLPPDHPAG